MSLANTLCRYSLVGCLLLTGASYAAPTLDATFALNYSITGLGGITGVPTAYGGLTFKDANTLLIGGAANSPVAKIYSVGVTRDAGGHITGFNGPPSFFANSPGIGSGGIDGGLAYGPDGVLFYTSFSDNSIGEIKPGSTSPDKQVALNAIGMNVGSVGTLTFAPSGALKILTYSGRWFSTSVTADGNGTYNISPPSTALVLNGGPEGLVYVPANSPVFSAPSILVSDYNAGSVFTYRVDANGDPIVNTRAPFLTGLGNAEGAAIDPQTGDFLFSTFTGSAGLFRVSGFAAPVTGTPEPGTWTMLASGALLLSVASLRSRKS